VPLSESEEQLLAQIERDLTADDPKLAHSVRNQTPRSYSLTRLRHVAYIFLLGIAILISSVIISSPIVSVLLGLIAFTVMLLAALHGARHLPSSSRGRSFRMMVTTRRPTQSS
jgi:uncharacterized membrane protein